jgi:hypothetical protein
MAPPQARKISGLTLYEYVEQRKWDCWMDDEDAQSRPNEARFAAGQVSAYQDVLNFLIDAYRPEFLEAVADRIARRKLTGPR